jgi:hypothetical protein
MTRITYRAWVDGLEALTVSGVTRRFSQGQPAALNTADLPAQWVQIPVPAGEESGLAFGGSGMERTVRADLVVALEPVGQSTQPANFDAAVSMLDSISAALEGDTAHELATGSPEWTMRLAIIQVAGNLYWAVVATAQAIA